MYLNYSNLQSIFIKKKREKQNNRSKEKRAKNLRKKKYNFQHKLLLKIIISLPRYRVQPQYIFIKIAVSIISKNEDSLKYVFLK